MNAWAEQSAAEDEFLSEADLTDWRPGFTPPPEPRQTGKTRRYFPEESRSYIPEDIQLHLHEPADVPPSVPAEAHRSLPRGFAYCVAALSLLVAAFTGFLTASYVEPSAPVVVPANIGLPAPVTSVSMSNAADEPRVVQPPVEAFPTTHESSVREKAPSHVGLNGWWTITNRVEPTENGTSLEVNTGYRVKLTQDGRQIEGTGHKWMENGRQLGEPQRTPVIISGVVDDRRVTMTMVALGGESIATFTYEMAGDALVGQFKTDDTLLRGSSQLLRIAAP